MKHSLARVSNSTKIVSLEGQEEILFHPGMIQNLMFKIRVDSVTLSLAQSKITYVLTARS